MQRYSLKEKLYHLQEIDGKINMPVKKRDEEFEEYIISLREEIKKDVKEMNVLLNKEEDAVNSLNTVRAMCHYFGIDFDKEEVKIDDWYERCYYPANDENLRRIEKAIKANKEKPEWEKKECLFLISRASRVIPDFLSLLETSNKKNILDYEFRVNLVRKR